MSRAILVTRCGCARAIDFPLDGNRHPLEYNIPLLNTSPAFLLKEFDPLEPVEILARRFRLTTKEENGVPVMEEVDVRPAIRPPAAPPNLTTGEWADVVARARAWCSGDLEQQDEAFLLQHPAATIVTHRGGALIGAFYESVSWSHASEVVRFFREARRLGFSVRP